MSIVFTYFLKKLSKNGYKNTHFRLCASSFQLILADLKAILGYFFSKLDFQLGEDCKKARGCCALLAQAIKAQRIMTFS